MSNIYIPYGEEWEKELLKVKKKDIIKMLKDVCLERDELQEELYNSINGCLGNIKAGKL